MSTITQGHTHESALARRGDPTNTRRIQENFRRDVAGRFRRVRGAIRTWAGYDQDVFELRAAAARPQDVFRFETDAGKRRAFLRWLRERIRAGILEPVSMQSVRDGEHWTGTYIRAAYRRGWANATGRLQARGVGVDSRSIDAALNQPIPQRQLRTLWERTFENLQSVTRATARPVREVLTDGLARGWNPRKMADRLTDEVRDIQHTRARVLARTEVINSYTTATIARYEDAGVSRVVGEAEWASADDDRVCPICEFLDGDMFSIEEVKLGTFRFEPQDDDPDHLAGRYPLRPPVHPQCRCALLPVVS